MKISDKAIRITELLSGVAIVITGIFLLLVSLDVFPFTIQSCWVIALFSCFFVISLIVAVLQKNSIGIAFCWIFGLLALAQLFIVLGLAVRNVYPIYIIALGLAVANGAAFAKLPSSVIKISLVIVSVGMMLFLESFAVLNALVVLPIIVVYLGMLGVVYSLYNLIKTKKSHNKEKK